MIIKKALLVFALGIAAGIAHAGTTTFTDGITDGWQGMQPLDGNGGTFIDNGMGVGAPALHTQMENFGISFSNSSNSALLGELTKTGAVTLSLDVATQSIWYFNREVTRSMVVELRDYDNQTNGLPYSSVWYELGTLDASKPEWQHLSVTIDDTSAVGLPSGWGGYGAEDEFGNPYLPADRSFASILAGTDEIVFSTYVPGYVYGFTTFDVAVDNLSVSAVSAVPEPESVFMMLSGLGLLGFMARRQKRRAASQVAA